MADLDCPWQIAGSALVLYTLDQTLSSDWRETLDDYLLDALARIHDVVACELILGTSVL
jgi:hypothetical protein